MIAKQSAQIREDDSLWGFLDGLSPSDFCETQVELPGVEAGQQYLDGS
jgi:ubiquitin thioesterase protein OTUB1